MIFFQIKISIGYTSEAIDRVKAFCEKYGIDYEPEMASDEDAKEIWNRLQQAYHARMYELQSGIQVDKEPDFYEGSL